MLRRQVITECKYCGLEDISLYWIKAIKDVLYPSTIIHILVFCLLAVINLLITKCIKQKKGFIRDLKRVISNKTKFYILAMMIIEPNLSRIAFHSFNQLTMLSMYNPFNMLNIVPCISVLFTIIFYSISYYCLVYHYSKKTS